MLCVSKKYRKMYKNILIAFLAYSFHLAESKAIAKIRHSHSYFSHCICTLRTLISSDFIFCMIYVGHFALKFIQETFSSPWRLIICTLGSACIPYNTHGSNTECTLADSLIHVKKKTLFLLDLKSVGNNYSVLRTGHSGLKHRMQSSQCH